MRHYTATLQDDGMRLDQYLAKVKPDLTRAFIQKLIKGGHVFVNNKKTVKPAYKLAGDDELIVDIPSIRETGIVAEDIPLDIVYEDNDIVVSNKPAGMVVHPTDHGAHVSGTLVNALMHHCKDLSGIGGEKRPGIVHRLDRNTTGIMLVAKTDEAQWKLGKLFEHREIQKTYVAIVHGELELDADGTPGQNHETDTAGGRERRAPLHEGHILPKPGILRLREIAL